MPQNKSYQLTPKAEVDLMNIWSYSFEQWGEVQADEYIRSLYSRFEWLADNPYLGRRRPEVADGYYSCVHSSHMIFYLVEHDSISIIGIPHQAMDVGNYFN